MNAQTADSQPPAELVPFRRSREPGIRYQLGTDLRQLREARRLRLEDAAAHVGVAPSTLSRIETGKGPARTCFVSGLLDLYGVDDEERRAALTGMAREGQRASWWDSYRDQLPARLAQYLSLETAASRVRCYSPQLIPELLQTPDYAAAAYRASRPGLTREQSSLLVELLGKRQELVPATGRQTHVIINEPALGGRIGSASVMAAQLDYLRDAARDSEVIVQVLTARPDRLVISPAFTLLDFSHQASPAGCSYGPAGQIIFAKGRNEVQAMETVFGALAETALPPEASASVIDEAWSRWRDET
jgi:transcriptional regulator with XRE-family HTH domain